MSTNEVNAKSFDVKYKILLLGDTLVGKTSIQRHIAGKDFRPDIGSTIGLKRKLIQSCWLFSVFLGVDFVQKIVPVERAQVNLQVW